MHQLESQKDEEEKNNSDKIFTTDETQGSSRWENSPIKRSSNQEHYHWNFCFCFCKSQPSAKNYILKIFKAQTVLNIVMVLLPILHYFFYKLNSGDKIRFPFKALFQIIVGVIGSLIGFIGFKKVKKDNYDTIMGMLKINIFLNGFFVFLCFERFLILMSEVSDIREEMREMTKKASMTDALRKMMESLVELEFGAGLIYLCLGVIFVGFIIRNKEGVKAVKNIELART